MTTKTAEIQNELLDVLETKLNQLAFHWRSTNDPEAIAHYQAILRCMIELGFNDPLDVDAELPDTYMPVEYLALHR